MSVHCQGKSKAIVNILTIKDSVTSTSPPVEVSINQASPDDLKCWKVKGLDIYGNSFAFFTCAKTGELQSGSLHGAVTDTNGNPFFGLVPVFDGKCWNGAYGCDGRSQNGATIQIVTKVDEPSILGGNCNSCLLEDVYILEIKDTTGIIYKEEFEKRPEYNVRCDEECPPNHIKCEQPKYPGYCCLPCDPIAQRIKNLAARIN